jgi:hypothetical protein
MILSVNATVCVIGTMVSNWRFMIIYEGRRRRVPEDGKRGSEQAKRKLQS